MTVAALVLAAALVVWSPPRSVVAGRLRSLTAAPPGAVPAEPGAQRGDPAAAVRRRWLLAVGGGLAAGLLLGGWLGVVAGAGVTAGVEATLRRAPNDERRSRAVLAADLPVTCDLLAVCLGAGLPVSGALAAVAAAVPGPVGDRLSAVAALYRLGAPPRRAWAEVPDELAGLARTLIRAGESGSSVIPALQALAAEARAAERGRAEVAVRRAGVWVLAPLGACFLPAFLCLGVVPLVLGIAADVFP
ncbi:type II secretion system F family protein [Geodermatophilus ruber]|uniref:Type II secretion system (T2SS), protein F n=1 Tax=Geodermatophilus ruber TaxID=504800 RepID=A0A1I4D6H8_9ACTN|nr:type II secretion system F family protein [Geodermatophilus ruber]SFK89178.1 Type II secretion system (T2SS), protein F [Geodermatophilus ruber]